MTDEEHAQAVYDATAKLNTALRQAREQANLDVELKLSNATCLPSTCLTVHVSVSKSRRFADSTNRYA